MYASILLFFVVITFSSLAKADELRTYLFTSSFVDCVQSGRERSDTVGSVDSSEMGGENVISGEKLDGQYWNYMNCLSKVNSGVNNESLRQTVSCPGAWVRWGASSLYISPATHGKKVNLNGAVLSCNAGQWSASGTNVTISDSPSGRNSCAVETKQIGACEYSLPSKPDGSSVKVFSNIVSGVSSNGFYSGEALFSCVDGVWSSQVESTVCEQQRCEIGEVVTWSSGDAVCDGVVDGSGRASLLEKENIYFSTLLEAKNKTKVQQGSASFSCSSGGWKFVSGSCKQKTLNELVCKTRLTSTGMVEHFCM